MSRDSSPDEFFGLMHLEVRTANSPAAGKPKPAVRPSRTSRNISPQAARAQTSNAVNQSRKVRSGNGN